ncbi:hypothetical protein JB92DRAFT_2909656, partial [Gautieria morchelliformis]
PLEALKPHVHEIYNDMSRFSIEHMDIRWRNLLAAPAVQQSAVCPDHGHMHRWRVVDFDLSRKSNPFTFSYRIYFRLMASDHTGWIGREIRRRALGLDAFFVSQREMHCKVFLLFHEN